jgi:hypothetical protein
MSLRMALVLQKLVEVGALTLRFRVLTSGESVS